MVEAEPKARHRYTVGQCGRCGAFELHRTSARTFAQKLVKTLTPLVPMRCPACGTRTLRLPAAAKPRPSPPPAREPVRSPPHSRRERRRRRRVRRRIRAAVWLLGAAATAAALGYYASLG